MKDEELADEIIARLNDMLGNGDTTASLNMHEALEALIEARVPCAVSLTAHPTLQVIHDNSTGVTVLGTLGLLNGVVGVRKDGRGHITAFFDDNGRLVRFEHTARRTADG